VVEHLASPRPGYPGFNFQYCIKKKRDRERERERGEREWALGVAKSRARERSVSNLTAIT
jgi:hypothetical protein